MKYRNLIAALGVLSLSSAGAMAADMAYKAPPPPPPPPPSWTGFYIGVNGGAGWGTSESNLNVGGLLAGLGIPGVALNVPISSHGLNGFLAGGQAGYNWQTGKFLLGIEADGDWDNIQGTTPCIVVFACTAKEKWNADITARVGVLPMSDLLVYVKGGATWANMNYTFGNSIAVGPFSAFVNSNVTNTQVGGLLGMGTEYMFLPHWTAKIEYNFADYGKHDENFPVNSGIAIAGVGAVNFPTINAPIQTNLYVHTMKAGINYLF